MAAGGATVGWHPTCNTRGTWDILWNCIQTMALCAWVSVCTSVPAPEAGDWDICTDKFFFVLLTLLGPDLVFLLAYAQYQSAKASRALFLDIGHPDWTLMHGFYADMGGIHIQPPGWKSFPVNAKQIHYLVKHGYMDYPVLPKKEIEARGKTDSLARIIVAGQAINFLVTTIARFASGLAVSTMELTVFANIFCTLATYVAWWAKPNGVSHSHLFPLKVPIELVIREAGEQADNQYRETPMDFASREEWEGSLLWNYYVNILRRLGVLRFFNLHMERPAQRFSSINFPKPRSRVDCLYVACTALAYTGVFFGAWNSHFPSRGDMIVWRAMAIAQTSISLICAIWGIVAFDRTTKSRSAWRQEEQDHAVDSKPKSDVQVIENKRDGSRSPKPLRDLWNMPCNNELTGKFDCMDVPFRSVLLMTPFCAAYCCCRITILIEDVIGLRALPASAYQQVNWTPYWPWF